MKRYHSITSASFYTYHMIISEPVVVAELDVAPGLQDLSVLQPGEQGPGLALGLAAEDGGGPHRPGDGLRGLDELCRCWGTREGETE